jgi:hypothetical protein
MLTKPLDALQRNIYIYISRSSEYSKACRTKLNL